MKYVEKQMVSIFSQILYRHAEVVSGAYKVRKVERACGKNDDGTTAWRPLTEAELLDDSMRVMQAQIRRLDEFVDFEDDD